MIMITFADSDSDLSYVQQKASIGKIYSSELYLNYYPMIVSLKCYTECELEIINIKLTTKYTILTNL